ncbi:hypothetical protein evm_002795 [Chilo suppressalis]|nr:hypothetical protein evm_002795 [Chilo suppressalis]
MLTDSRILGIEVPASVDNRVYCYSHYKKGFTAKLLIGITPGGFISFKSKVAGGRQSDSQMMIESGLIDYLDDGDIVLADKGFPQIKTAIDRSGKEVKIEVLWVSLFCESSELPRDLFLCCLEKMPRNYKRKKLPKYTQDDMAKAIQAVLKDEMSMYAAAKNFGIPTTTLFDRLRNNTSNVGRPLAIPFSSEQRLADAIAIMEK